MQSSTIVVLRALVMLGCLVAIPLAALFGGALPGMVKDLLAGRLPSLSPPPAARLDEAPRFEPLPEAQPLLSASAVPVAQPPTSTAVIPAGYDASIGPVPDARPARQPLAQKGVSPLLGVGGRASHLVPPGNTADTHPRPIAQPGEQPKVDRFKQVQDRLRELGAAYYRLEAWGSGQELYRFHCRVAIDGNPNFLRYFEDTDRDPLRAMTEVLRQIEQWRAERALPNSPGSS